LVVFLSPMSLINDSFWISCTSFTTDPALMCKAVALMIFHYIYNNHLCCQQQCNWSNTHIGIGFLVNKCFGIGLSLQSNITDKSQTAHWLAWSDTWFSFLVNWAGDTAWYWGYWCRVAGIDLPIQYQVLKFPVLSNATK
jgi:hypothetical protein